MKLLLIEDLQMGRLLSPADLDHKLQENQRKPAQQIEHRLVVLKSGRGSILHRE